MTLTTTSIQQPTCHLLNLPPELRLIIYEFAIPDVKQKYFFHRERPPKACRWALLNTCKFIRQEAGKMYKEGLVRVEADAEKAMRRAEATVMDLRDDLDKWREYWVAEERRETLSVFYWKVREEREKITGPDERPRSLFKLRWSASRR